MSVKIQFLVWKMRSSILGWYDWMGDTLKLQPCLMRLAGPIPTCILQSSQCTALLAAQHFKVHGNALISLTGQQKADKSKWLKWKGSGILKFSLAVSIISWCYDNMHFEVSVASGILVILLGFISVI